MLFRSILDDVQAGMRFTYLNRNLDAQDPANPPLPANYHLTGVPYSQTFAYVTWDVLPELSLTPSIQTAANRWSNLPANNNVFLKTGSFFLVNFEAQYSVTDKIDIQVGARNLFDVNYQLIAGFPSEGRSVFMNLRIRS